jgi:hypothetical protein
MNGTMRLQPLRICFTLLLFLGACTPAVQSPAPTAAPSPIATHAPVAGATTAQTPTLAATPDRTQYNLSVVFDVENKHLDVVEWVTYVNRSDVYLSDLLFVVEPLRWEGAFQLRDIRWADGAPLSGLRLEGVGLRLPLREALAPGSSVTLQMHFELNLPEPAGTFGSTGRQFNFADWYPYLPAYNPQRGWLVHPPAYIGEHQAYDVADYHVEWAWADPADALILAASAAPQQVDGEMHFDFQTARCFTLSASEEYEVISTQEGPWNVRAYVFPEHAAAGETAVKVAVEALTLYDEIFMPYPYDGLTIVEADFFDGLETSGLFFLDQTYFDTYDEYPTGWLTTLVAHETSHQWWHTLVGSDQAMEPWLDEALATYSERLFYEFRHPEWVDWWWYRRVDIFHPQGPIDGRVYDYEDFRDYVDSVYLRGVRFLEAVRLRIGDEAFFEFLKAYAQFGDGKLLTSQDFFQILADHSDEDISGITLEFFDSAP